MTTESKQMNVFNAVDNLRETYQRYVFTFQKFRNPAIQEWVNEKMSEGGLLWKDTHVELKRRFKAGLNIQEHADTGLLHPKTPNWVIQAPGRRNCINNIKKPEYDNYYRNRFWKEFLFWNTDN